VCVSVFVNSVTIVTAAPQSQRFVAQSVRVPAQMRPDDASSVSRAHVSAS
jgi:hypothetical protein